MRNKDTEEKKTICPQCGRWVGYVLHKPRTNDFSAAGYPQREIQCICGYHGFWDIEFGWKENFSFPSKL